MDGKMNTPPKKGITGLISLTMLLLLIALFFEHADAAQPQLNRQSIGIALQNTAADDPDTVAVIQPATPVVPVTQNSDRVMMELSRLGETLENRVTDAEVLLSDRIAAVDQRLAGVERRSNETFLRISTFEQQFWYIIIALLLLSLITVLSIVVLTFRFIEPMKKENKMLNESLIKLQTQIPKNSDNIHQALKDLAKDDPYIAQILKKNNRL